MIQQENGPEAIQNTRTTEQDTSLNLLHLKVDMTIVAIDNQLFEKLPPMFSQTLQAMGITELSAKTLLPTNRHNTRPYFDCLKWIISTVLDGQVDDEEFAPFLVARMNELKELVK